MAVETSLSKLQIQVEKLSKENTRLRDLLTNQKEKNKNLQKQIKYIENVMEEKIKNAVIEATKDLILENNKLKEENDKLKSILNNDSNNSGLPTSKTPIGKDKRIPNSREKSKLTKGGQSGHKKNKLEKFTDEEITDTYQHQLDSNKCSCGGKLIIIGKKCKDEFDVQIRLMKIRHEFYEYECDCCKKQIKVPVPNKLKEENQYGSNVQAIAVSLLNEGYVSMHRTRELISGFTGNELEMSEGYIAKLQKRCYDKLENFDNELHQKIIKQPVIHWDDTVISIDKKNACLRFYGTETLAYYKSHLKKNKEGLDEDGILKYLSKETVVVHDHNKVNYNDDYEFTNAECCVHLIRDLKKINEAKNREWINDMIKLLVDTNNKRKEYINKSIYQFDYEVVDNVIDKYDKLLKQAKAINKSDFNQYSSQDEKNIIDRLEKYKDNYLLWIIRFDVPFSNNISERSLRNSKTKMKVSGQFSNLKNAEYFARIKSYIETCKRHDINIHNAIVRLLEENPYTVGEILKIPKKAN